MLCDEGFFSTDLQVQSAPPVLLQVMDFPLFHDPAAYIALREGRFAVKTRLKKWYEQRAMDRCLALTGEITSVCDIPSGPGRLFEYWLTKGWAVTGMDLSEEMVQASRALHQSLALDGSVRHHNAFEEYPGAFDIVASVRFIYYFERAERVRLIQSLASMSNRYLLLQYKTSETRKGAINARKPLNAKVAYRKYHCTHQEIVDEISEAGLLLLGIECISHSSDRVFVIAEKPRA